MAGYEYEIENNQEVNPKRIEVKDDEDLNRKINDILIPMESFEDLTFQDVVKHDKKPPTEETTEEKKQKPKSEKQKSSRNNFQLMAFTPDGNRVALQLSVPGNSKVPESLKATKETTEPKSSTIDPNHTNLKEELYEISNLDEILNSDFDARLLIPEQENDVKIVNEKELRLTSLNAIGLNSRESQHIDLERVVMLRPPNISQIKIGQKTFEDMKMIWLAHRLYKKLLIKSKTTPSPFLWEFHESKFDHVTWKKGLKNHIKHHKKSIKQVPIDLKKLKTSKFECTPKSYHYKKEKVIQEKKDAMKKLKQCKEELKIGSIYIKHNIEQIKQARETNYINIHREACGMEPLPLWTKKKPKRKQTETDPFDRHHWWYGFGCLGYCLFRGCMTCSF